MATHDSVRVEFESTMGPGDTGSNPQGSPNAGPFPVVLPLAGKLELKAA